MSGVPIERALPVVGEAVDIAMTNYRTYERAWMYKKMGIVGDMMSPLTTFKHNYFTQLYKYGKDALTRGVSNPKTIMPFLAFIQMQALFGGLMGMPGREDMDDLANLGKKMGIIPSDWPVPTEMLLKLAAQSGNQMARDGIAFGGISAMTGADVSPTFAAAHLLPDVSMRGVMPVANLLTDIGGASVNVGMKELARLWGGPGATTADYGKLMKAGVPPAYRAVTEKAMQDPATGILRDPTRQMEGTVRRQEQGWPAAVAGSRPTDEAMQMQAARVQQAKDTHMAAEQTAVANRATELALDGKPFQSEAKRYVELGGDPEQLLRTIETKIMASKTTREERMALKARTNQQLMRFQSYSGMRGKPAQ
jgi:hypothetical protein